MCHSLTIFFCLYSICVRTSKEMLHLSRTESDSVTSFSLMLHSRIVSKSIWSMKKGFLRATFYCFSPAAHHLCRTFPLSMSLLSSRHIQYSVSVSAEEITQMEEGTCQLTSSSFITVCLWPLYAVGESAAATCVSG